MEAFYGLFLHNGGSCIEYEKPCLFAVDMWLSRYFGRFVYYSHA